MNIVHGPNGAVPLNQDVFTDGYLVNTLNTGGADLIISTGNSLNGNPENLTVVGGATPANVSWNSGNSLTLIGNNSVTLEAGTTIANLGSGGLSLQSSGAISHNGTINLAGNVTINAGAGGTVALNGSTTAAGLNVTAGGGIGLNNDVSSSGTLDFNGAVTLGGAGGLRTVSGANVDFASTVSGAGNSLTVNSPGATTFGGAVSGVNALVTDAPGNTAINADITTAGNQTYNDAVTLGGAGVRMLNGGTVIFGSTVALNNDVNSSGTLGFNGAVTLGGAGGLRTVTGANVDFASTVSGAGNSLTVNSPGATTFGGVVSGVNALVTDAPGNTAINADITTAGNQTYNDAVTLGGVGGLRTVSGANVDFASTVAGAGNSLTVNSPGATTFGGAVSGVNALATDAAGNTAINANVTTVGTQIYNDAVTTASGVALTGGTVTFGGRLSPGGDSAAAALTINGNLVFGPASTLFVNFNGTAPGIDYDQITTVGGSITIHNGAVLNGQAGFAYNVGDVVTVIRNTPGSAVSGTFDPGASVTLSSQKFTFDYINGGAHNVNLVRAGTVWIWDGGSATGNNWSDPANWSFNASHPGNGDVVHFAGITRLTPNNNLNGLSLSQIFFDAGSGAFTLGGNSLTLGSGIVNNSVNPQTINMPLTLAGNQSFNATLGQLVFGGTINGAFTLTLNGPNTITLGGAASLAGLVANTPVALNNDVTTTGGQTYSGAVVQGANAHLTGTTLTVGPSWNANAHDLWLTFGSGVAVPGVFTDVGNFKSDGAGGTTIGGTLRP